MKAPAFQFYARDFRASLSVTVMSSAQRGGYIMLLAAAWDFDKPGYLPNDDDLLRLYSGMTEDEWKAGSGRLLKQFPLTEDGLLRYNARLISEVEKQANYRESRAKGGQAAAAKRAAAQQEASIKSSYAEPTQAYEQPEASIAPTLLSASANCTSSNDDERERASSSADNSPLKAEKKPTKSELVALAAAESDVQVFSADDWPGLTNPATFASICQQLALPTNLDQATYRAMIQTKMRGLHMKAPASTMASWIASFFVNERRNPKGLLVLVAPTYNETASNAQAGAITGSTIPAMSSMLKDPQIR